MIHSCATTHALQRGVTICLPAGFYASRCSVPELLHRYFAVLFDHGIKNIAGVRTCDEKPLRFSVILGPRPFSADFSKPGVIGSGTSSPRQMDRGALPGAQDHTRFVRHMLSIRQLIKNLLTAFNEEIELIAIRVDDLSSSASND